MTHCLIFGKGKCIRWAPGYIFNAALKDFMCISGSSANILLCAFVSAFISTLPFLKCMPHKAFPLGSINKSHYPKCFILCLHKQSLAKKYTIYMLINGMHISLSNLQITLATVTYLQINSAKYSWVFNNLHFSAEMDLK